MAVNQVWNVVYGFMDNTTKRHGWDGQQHDLVIAADSKESTIKNVLTTNGRGRPGATIDIISVTPAGINVLS